MRRHVIAVSGRHFLTALSVFLLSLCFASAALAQAVTGIASFTNGQRILGRKA